MFNKRIFFYSLLLLIIVIIGGCSIIPPVPATYTITVISGDNGSITPEGKTTVTAGDNLSLSITAEEGYVIADILIDGKSILPEGESVGKVYTYIFTDVQKNHTIEVSFKKETTPPDPGPEPGPIQKKYTVQFLDWDDRVLKTQAVIEGKPANSPAAPTRTGYTFTGWDIPFNNVITDLIVTAQYSINQYTITFDSADGTEVLPITQNYGTAVTPPDDPTKEGFDFDGWNPAIPATMPAENITLTAQWTIKTYTVTYNAGIGGSITGISTQTVNHGGSGTEVQAVPDSGYQFIKWDDDILTAKRTDTNVTADITVVAEFKAPIAHNINLNKYYYTTIQAAIDEAIPGQEVEVYPGTHNENIVLNNKNITLQSNSGNPNDTIIDGGNNGSVVTFSGGDTSTLSGFTITKGSGTFDRVFEGADVYVGGGIYIEASSPIITNNTITGNTTGYGGGIMVINSSNADINNNTITNNTAVVASISNGDGGGIAVFEDSYATITNNEIYSNTAWKGGGIAVYDYSSADISSNTSISNNTAISLGGGILVFSNCNASIANNSIANNSGRDGGGINVSYDANATIDNNIIDSNTASDWGGGICIYYVGTATVSNNNEIKNNKADVGGGIYVSIDSSLLPDSSRPEEGWGKSGDSDYRRNIPYLSGIDLIPPVTDTYIIAANSFFGNTHGSSLLYSQGAHVYFINSAEAGKNSRRTEQIKVLPRKVR